MSEYVPEMDSPFFMYDESLPRNQFNYSYDEDRELHLATNWPATAIAVKTQGLSMDILTVTEKTGEPTDHN